VVVLGSALALAGCNQDECASAGDCSPPYTGYSGNGNGNVGAGGGNLAGDEPGQACIFGPSYCEWRPITASSDAASLSAFCRNDEYDVATDCPSEGLIGCCAGKTRIECHYSSTGDMPKYMQQCEGLLGTWLTAAP
jgi:hypothetical protein